MNRYFWITLTAGAVWLLFFLRRWTGHYPGAVFLCIFGGWLAWMLAAGRRPDPPP